MRRPLGGPTCEVPGCARTVGKEPPFCARCWRLMTDEEIAGLRFARHAPFWPRYVRHDEDCPEQLVPCFDPNSRAAGAPVGVYACDGYLFTDEGGTLGGRQDYRYGLGQRLREFEARTTQQAVALILGDRLWQHAQGWQQT